MSSSIETPVIFPKLSIIFELLQIDQSKFHKSFKPRHPISNALHPLIFVCPICKIQNNSGKCKKFLDLWALECHIRKQHKGFSDQKTKLNFEKTLALIKLTKLILFLGVVA